MCNTMIICPLGVIMGVIISLETLQRLELSNHWVDSLQIKFIGTILICGCATSWSFAHQGHMGVPTGITITLVTLWTLNLSNHWADFLQITFNGTILACRCAISWSFAHCSHIGMLTDVILNLEMLQTLQLSNHWADSFQIKFIGTVLVCRYAGL